ncbi:MAG TPA: DinB family protein [Streptosporangiaceae bacterium]|nr:DinB family protein [Streptosporangiaceae bacterium]
MAEVMNRQAVHDELEGARAAFHRLLGAATEADLRRASDGTRWNNEQLLFHMLFGYLITRALLMLAHVFGRLPAGASKGFAWLLGSLTGPFDVVNYYGSCAGARLIGRQRMGAKFDRVIVALHRRLAAETEAHLRRGMHYPVRWDPFFKDFMSLADIYHYPTQHFEFHRRQLTVSSAS